MRTNPFFDAWLFIIGSTDDHQKLGAAKFLLVALFLVLVAVSLWIAWTNWREDPGQRSGAHITTCVCRVLIGCMWFQGCLWKLPLPISDGFQYWTGEMAENAAFAFYRALGWQPFLGTIFADQPDGRIQHTSVAPFVYDLKYAPRDGVIDLCGLPW